MITEEQIWNYVEGTLDAESRTQLERALAADKSISVRFKEISALHKQLKTEKVMKPSLSFTENVMTAISMHPAYLPASAISVRTMLLFFLPTVAAIIFLAVLLVKNNISITMDIPIPDYGRYKIMFALASILFLAYIVDTLPDRGEIAVDAF